MVTGWYLGPLKRHLESAGWVIALGTLEVQIDLPEKFGSLYLEVMPVVTNTPPDEPVQVSEPMAARRSKPSLESQ